ncbi:M23 family metallopeptidase [Effusibacillus dendaii]|nr:M23 family metallopeptidase [Effusibacillus dendaii]
MNEEKNQLQNLAPRSQKKPGFWKTLFAKRWTFPALYLGAAAVIIGIVVAGTQYKHQEGATPAPQGNVLTDPSAGTDTQPVTAGQNLIWPMAADGTDAQVTMSFYDDSKDEKTKANSIVRFDNNFYTQNGVVIGRKDDKPFSVVAAASGTVTRVENDPLMGQVVEIAHDNGYVTYYASLQNVQVKQGDKVVQSQPIGQSGNNKLEADQKNHLHFEVKKDSKYINPQSVLPPRGQ